MTPAGSEERDSSVEELSRLARRSLSGAPPRREDGSFARVGGKMMRLKRRRAALTVAGTAALLIALVVGAGALLRSPGTLTYSVMNGAVVDGERVVAGADTTVRFSDGSELVLERGAETHIRALDAHGGNVVLDEGTANVAIAKRPSATWTLSAGPYLVRVTGTRFSLRWSQRDRDFQIAMQSGSVVVSGPLLPEGMALAAGQRLRTSAAGEELTLDQASTLAAEGVDPRSVAVGGGLAAASSAASAPHAEEAPALAPPPTPSASSTQPSVVLLDWQKRAAAGEFAAVIAAAEARGLDAALASASLEDLAALADSARYARRTSLAQRVLLAERKRFPTSRAARDAAFFLARLAEDEGSGALEWYDRYLGESPRGTYAPQALGRKMLLVHAQQGSTAARPLAAEYLERYPTGPYAASARKIADAP